MKRKTIYLVIATLLIAALVIILYPTRTNALWGSSGAFRDGPRIDYTVHGYSNGEPIAGILLCYDNDKGLPNAITWESAGQDDGTDEFKVNNNLIEASDNFQLYINKPNGTIVKIDIPLDEARLKFSRDANSSYDNLIDLWKHYSRIKFQ